MKKTNYSVQLKLKNHRMMFSIMLLTFHNGGLKNLKEKV